MPLTEAERCVACGKRMGYIKALKGLGIRQALHPRRCRTLRKHAEEAGSSGVQEEETNAPDTDSAVCASSQSEHEAVAPAGEASETCNVENEPGPADIAAGGVLSPAVLEEQPVNTKGEHEEPQEKHEQTDQKEGKESTEQEDEKVGESAEAKQESQDGERGEDVKDREATEAAHLVCEAAEAAQKIEEERRACETAEAAHLVCEAVEASQNVEQDRLAHEAAGEEHLACESTEVAQRDEQEHLAHEAVEATQQEKVQEAMVAATSVGLLQTLVNLLTCRHRARA